MIYKDKKLMFSKKLVTTYFGASSERVVKNIANMPAQKAAKHE